MNQQDRYEQGAIDAAFFVDVSLATRERIAGDAEFRRGYHEHRPLVFQGTEFTELSDPTRDGGIIVRDQLDTI